MEMKPLRVNGSPNAAAANSRGGPRDCIVGAGDASGGGDMYPQGNCSSSVNTGDPVTSTPGGGASGGAPSGATNLMMRLASKGRRKGDPESARTTLPSSRRGDEAEMWRGMRTLSSSTRGGEAKYWEGTTLPAEGRAIVGAGEAAAVVAPGGESER